MGFSVNLEKDFLCDVFGFSFVAEDVDGYAMDQPNVSTKQCP
jgi:hypothetical protein